MPSISKIRFTNIVYEGGNKRYNDDIFPFDGHNGAILLENGGGKTVFIQTAIQTVLPHADLADRKIKDTLKLEDAPAHIAIEWILNEEPRRYALTCVSLFLTKNGLDSFRYVYEYGENDKHAIEEIPFVKTTGNKKRPAERGEIYEYYSYMTQNYMNAHTFDTIKSYKAYLEDNYHIIPKEWESIVKINSAEGGVEEFFNECKTTGQLFDRLLIPVVEDSITGFEMDEFAKTFEKHRKSFKEYKLLKEKIAENERIKERLDDYVKTFGQLDLKQQDYERSKETAKAYFELASEQRNRTELERQILDDKSAALKERQHRWLHEQASYELAVEKMALDEHAARLNDATGKQEAVQAKVTETESLYYSMKLAEYKKDFTNAKNDQEFYEERLKEFDQEADIEDIRIALDDNSRELKGHFMTRLETYEKEMTSLQFEANQLTNQITDAKKVLNGLQEERNGILKEQTQKQTAMGYNEKEMQQIEKETLSDPQNERVEEEYQRWVREANELDETNNRLISRNKQLETETEEIERERKEIGTQLAELNRSISSLQTTKKQFDDAHQRMKLKLAERRHEWTRLDSIYLKQDSIGKRLMETVEKLTADRDSLLYKERLAFRFVDDYSGQEIFHADPFLAVQITQWKNQFSYIETGLSFIQTNDGSADDHPLWPITLVTTAGEMVKLEDKVRRIADRLQYPVNIVTLDEAHAISDNGYPDDSNWIEPKHWNSNSDREAFAEWKASIQSNADEARERRLEQEKEIDSYKLLFEDFSSFLNQYPYDSYIDLKEQLSKAANDSVQLNVKDRKLEAHRSGIMDEMKKNRQTISDNRDKIGGLGNKIEKGQKYKKLSTENETLESELLYIATKLTELTRKVSRQRDMISHVEAEERKLNDRINELRRDQEREITDNPLYKEVQHAGPPIFTTNPIDLLMTKRKALQDDIEKKGKNRKELEIKIDNAAKTMEWLNREMDQLRNERSGLNEELEFPPNGTEKMQELWRRKTELLPSLQQFTEEVREYTADYIKQKTIVEELEKKVDGPVKFDKPLELIRKKLDMDREEITKEQKLLDTQIRQNDKQFHELSAVLAELDKYALRYLFLQSDVNKALLSAEEISDFTYNRKKKTDDILAVLGEKLKILTKEQERVERSKDKYIERSRSDIKDPRMRETAIQGIQNKHTYEDVLKYKELLENRISVVLKYAEENIMTHDKQLEQFIVHVHAHIKKITDELKLIPKKTSVKMDDQWKEIYAFSIPEWEDQHGKSAIREYVNWILDQLDKEEYKDDNGQDDTGKMRNSLEKWLQSKQLLRAVMNEKTMKVSCRKVTNDNKVSKATFSWEQSNVWSGGEKWSKNMTLFLGILNYIAEKRQHIQPNMKRHRTVIVDNPFGKASSDHVLNPVFFIAEQLGFQIIALTAHAEGKFLRDYFPVIYSCRLRNAEGSDKQIITKEKSIRMAYFQDHAPKSLDRLGEHEQMELLF